MINKKELKDVLKILGFDVVEKKENIIFAFRKNYQVGGEELWINSSELIIRPRKLGFQMKPKGDNKIVFIPI